MQSCSQLWGWKGCKDRQISQRYLGSDIKVRFIFVMEESFLTRQQDTLNIGLKPHRDLHEFDVRGSHSSVCCLCMSIQQQMGPFCTSEALPVRKFSVQSQRALLKIWPWRKWLWRDSLRTSNFVNWFYWAFRSEHQWSSSLSQFPRMPCRTGPRPGALSTYSSAVSVLVTTVRMQMRSYSVTIVGWLCMKVSNSHFVQLLGKTTFFFCSRWQSLYFSSTAVEY